MVIKNLYSIANTIITKGLFDFSIKAEEPVQISGGSDGGKWDVKLNITSKPNKNLNSVIQILVSTLSNISLTETEKVSISVYNELGQLIKTLVMENSVNPGKFKVVWDGTDNSGSEASNGIYLYSISNHNKVIKSGKIILKR